MIMIFKRSVFLLVLMLFAPLVAHSDVTGGGWIRRHAAGDVELRNVIEGDRLPAGTDADAPIRGSGLVSSHGQGDELKVQRS